MKPSSGNEQGPNDVESEEKDKGTDIEVDEEALPSRAAAIHEEIRQDGEKELSAMVWRCSGQPLRRAYPWAPR